MKQYITTILAALLVVAALPILSSCENEEVEVAHVGMPEFTLEVYSINTSSAYVKVINTGSASFNKNQIELWYSTDPSFANYETKTCAIDKAVSLTNLWSGSKYYLKVEFAAWNHINIVVNDEYYEFNRDDIGSPICKGDLSFTTRKM